jgi:TetR/AcrR family transcriptional regulator, transcriptional repressor for nem operon
MPRARIVKPAPRSREATKQETRDALIAAGIELFGEEGLDAPSLDAICERAGYTRGAFYVHFADRDAFLVAVMDRVGEAFLDDVLARAGEGADLFTIVQRFLLSLAEGSYPLTRGGVRPHQLIDACVRSPAIRARYLSLVKETITRVASAVSQGQSDGMLRPDVDADAVATVLLATVIGAQTMLELEAPLDVTSVATTLMKVMAPARSRR